MNFFQYRCYLEAKVPRVDGGKKDGIAQVEVPWARPGVGFTLLMEAMMLLLAQSGMTVAEVGRTLSFNTNTYWRVLGYRVHEAHDQVDVKEVDRLLVDENESTERTQLCDSRFRAGRSGREEADPNPVRHRRERSQDAGSDRAISEGTWKGARSNRDGLLGYEPGFSKRVQ